MREEMEFERLTYGGDEENRDDKREFIQVSYYIVNII